VRRCVVETLESRQMLDAGPVVTEFMTSNTDTVLDGDGASSDWIEICNPTDAPVSLDGWYLTDRADDLIKWEFPNVTLAASGDPGGGDYLLVFASDHDDDDYPYYDGDGYLHTNFALSKSGESVLLVRPDGETIAHGYIDYPPQITDVSYGSYLGLTSSTLVGAGAPVSYHVPTPADAALMPVPGGDAGWTAPGFDDSAWTDAIVYGAAGILVTEVNTGDTDFVEVQNSSSEPIDVTGWRVLVNDATASDANDVHATAWDLSGVLAPGDVRYRTDDSGDNYWGSDVFWEDDGPGWVMILDATGNVMDFVAWGYVESKIATLEIDFGPFSNITVGRQFTGDGAPAGAGNPAAAAAAMAGTVSYGGGTYTESFDSMGPGGTALPTGWAAGKYSTTQNRQPPGSAPANESLYVDDGSSSTKGRSYNYGTSGGADRAVGHLPTTSSGDRAVQLAIANNTGYAIDEFTLDYTGEQWREWEGGAASAEKLSVWFSTSPGSGFIELGSEFHFEAPRDSGLGVGEGTALDGNDPANRLAISGTFAPPAPISNGQTFYLTWHDQNDNTSDHALAVDDVSFSAAFGPQLTLERSGDVDSNTAGDFGRSSIATKGVQNSGLTVPFGAAVAAITGLGFSNGQSAYDDLIATDVEARMKDVNASLWARIEFNAGDTSAFEAITLRMKYDDGYIAYLNGTELASAHAPGVPAYNSAATAAHPNSQAVVYEDIDVTAHRDAFQMGTNVLAIHGLNAGAADDDFLIQPALLANSEASPPRFFGNATPGAENDPSLGAPTAAVSFSRPSGLFTQSSIQVALSVESPGAVIHYTLGGSLPTESSPVYTTPLNISATTQVRARAYETGFPAGETRSESYVKLASDQLGYQADLPVLVIDTFGSGVPSNSLAACFIGLFDRQEDGWTDFTADMDLATRAGIKTRGSSTSGESFAFEAWDEQNEDKDIALLGLPEESDFILYRSRYDKSMMNNSLMFELSNQVGQYAVRTRFVNVYLNTGTDGVSGADHDGVYVLMEKIKRGPDRVDVEKLDASDSTEPDVTGGYMLKIDRLDPGDSGFHTSRGLPTEYGYLCYVYPKEENLTAAQETWIRAWFEEFEDALYNPGDFTHPVTGKHYSDYIDVDAFIDFHILNELSKNPDMFWLSTYMYMPREGKLSMGPIWDFDRALGFEGRSVNPQGYVSFGAGQLPYHFDWWGRLFEDPEFEQQYIDRRFELHQGLMSRTNLHAIVDAQTAELANSMSGNGSWPGYVNDLKNWLTARLDWTGKHVLNASTVLPTVPSLNQDGGVLSPGFELTMNAPDGTIYYTLDGTDPRQSGGQPSAAAEIYSSSGLVQATLVEKGSSWRYLDDGSNLLTAWKEPGFNDDGWKSGLAQLGYGDGDEATVLSYGADPNDKHITTYFRHEFTVEDTSNITALALRLVRDDGAVVYLNGNVLAYPNMPSPLVTYDTPANANGDDGTFHQYSADRHLLVDETNVLAVEIHQRAGDSSDISFDLELVATVDEGGTTGSAIPLDETTLVIARNYDGSHWSAPQRAVFLSNTPADATNLAVTEIHYHPADPTPLELALLDDEHLTSEAFEFVEFTNISDQPVDVAGVQITQGIDFDFAAHGAMTLAPGQRAVVVSNAAAFAARYDTAGVLVAGEYDDEKTLANDGEQITILDAFGQTLFDFSYNDTGSWPGRADGKGAAMELIDPDAVPHDEPARTEYLGNGENWHASVRYGGTPGAEGDAPVGIVVNEVLSHTDWPSTDSIELLNISAEQIDLAGWYLSDDWGWDPTFATGNYKRFRIPDDDPDPEKYVLDPGEYIVFNELDFNPQPLDPLPQHFSFDAAHGDDVWLMKADGDEKLTHFVAHAEFGAQASGQSWGRWPDPDGPLYPMTASTLGSVNPGPRLGSVVISEVYYQPALLDCGAGSEGRCAADLEFVEIYNGSSSAVNLTHWKLRKGVDFDFPSGAMLGPHETLVIVPFDPATDADQLAAFRSHHGITEAVVPVGPYRGQLENNGERVRLQYPDAPPSDEPGYYPGLLEDEIVYDDASPWPAGAAGGGDSLHRTAAATWGGDVANWAAATPSPGSVEFATPTETTVVGRHVFYNDSTFDDGPAANATDDAAIATDKTALLPGEVARFANYTSYTQGINGIMVDLAGLPDGVTPGAGDFAFHTGNDSDPAGWTELNVEPTVTLRRGAGVGGSDRVTIIWPPGAIRNEWLQVTIPPTARFPLPTADVFYLGNAVAESGNAPERAQVTTADLLLARNNPRDVLTSPAGVTFAYDYDRDGAVNATDVLLARNNQTNFLSALNLIDLSAAESSCRRQTVGDAATDAVDKLLATYWP